MQIQYDGTPYNGFASQTVENDNSIEKHLFESLNKLHLIENRKVNIY